MSTNLRILFIVHGYKPAYRIGGPIISVSSMAEALVRKGHSVTVFTTNCNMSEDLDVPVNCPLLIDGVEVWYFRKQDLLKKLFAFIPYLSKSMGFLYSPAMLKQLQKIIPTIDVVHTHLPFIYPTYAAAHEAKLHNKPLFYHQRGVFDPARLNFRSLKKKFFLKIIEQPILRSATTLIALTDAEVASYKTLCSSTPCRVIPNGINVEEYYIKSNNTTLPDFRSDDTVILFLGRLHPIKGADKLIEAFIKVSKEVSDVILVMAGPDEFLLENRFQSIVKKNELQNRIIFPGMISGEIKKNLLARSNLFCLPSDAEGFSMAILEALASATAVMISPGCHFPEVEKVGAGKIVEVEPKVMANAIIELLKDKNKLAEMGRKGREFVSQNYTWDKIADQLIELYQEGISRHANERK